MKYIALIGLVIAMMFYHLLPEKVLDSNFWNCYYFFISNLIPINILIVSLYLLKKLKNHCVYPITINYKPVRLLLISLKIYYISRTIFELLLFFEEKIVINERIANIYWCMTIVLMFAFPLLILKIYDSYSKRKNY